MRCLSLNGFYSIVHECDFKIHTKTFPYYVPAYFMHILVLHLLLHYAIWQCHSTCCSHRYYWHSNKKAMQDNEDTQLLISMHNLCKYYNGKWEQVLAGFAFPIFILRAFFIYISQHPFVLWEDKRKECLPVSTSTPVCCQHHTILNTEPYLLFKGVFNMKTPFF